MTKKNEVTSVNTRVPEDLYAEVLSLCKATKKNTSQLVVSALRHYICQVKHGLDADEMLIDKFAWGLTGKNKEKKKTE